RPALASSPAIGHILHALLQSAVTVELNKTMELSNTTTGLQRGCRHTWRGQVKSHRSSTGWHVQSWQLMPGSSTELSHASVLQYMFESSCRVEGISAGWRWSKSKEILSQPFLACRLTRVGSCDMLSRPRAAGQCRGGRLLPLYCLRLLLLLRGLLKLRTPLKQTPQIGLKCLKTDQARPGLLESGLRGLKVVMMV
ncbi:hypothetical protein V8C86DRAFT_2720756, partial [Haematococcus lacustris]